MKISNNLYIYISKTTFDVIILYTDVIILIKIGDILNKIQSSLIYLMMY
jgi:hypothetical protein